MTNKEYREAEGISRSDLFKISKSPQHFKYEQENPSEQSKALLFGIALHSYVLEQNKFEEEYAVIPKVDRRKKEGKEIYAQFLAENEGKFFVENDDMEVIKQMAESINSVPIAKKLLEGKHEQSFFWTDDMTGEKCKCRPDILTEIGDTIIIADVKTCESAKTDTFMKKAVEYGYDLQAYMYCEGVRKSINKKCSFVFIAVEKKPPYAVNILQADEYMMLRGQDLFREYLGTYHYCKENNNWYSYNGANGDINNLSLPAWIRKDYEK